MLNPSFLQKFVTGYEDTYLEEFFTEAILFTEEVDEAQAALVKNVLQVAFDASFSNKFLRLIFLLATYKVAFMF